MKKLLSIMLVSALMISSFAGCAKQDTTDGGTVTPAVTSTPSQNDDTTGGQQW